MGNEYKDKEKTSRKILSNIISLLIGLILGLVIYKCPFYGKITEIKILKEKAEKVEIESPHSLSHTAIKESKESEGEEWGPGETYVKTQIESKEGCPEMKPAVELLESPPKLWNKKEAIFFLSTYNFLCYINDKEFPCNASLSSMVLVGEDGKKTFSVYYAAGKCREKILEYDFVVDTTPPITEIKSVDFSYVLTEPEGEIDFIVNEPYKSTLCSVDDGFWMDCSSGRIVLTNIEDGWHKISAFSIDLAGNKEKPPKEFYFRVDAKPPVTLLLSAPPSATNVNYAEFEFTSDEEDAEFECDINYSGWKKCSSPLKLTNLKVGLNTIKIRARDSFGRYEKVPIIYSWGFMEGEFLTGTPKPYVPPKAYLEILKRKRLQKYKKEAQTQKSR